ncbi:NAD-dependent epimerase/dehydratase family protein, partial [Candidatus Poribacteria bacterium]|nr:NAD-dependent epimerase/dehydratase family protein [Candidatus Poribacteria bacterium]
MRVVVVGGTGNISTSIVRELLGLGHEVTCYNRGRSGSPPDGVRVIQGDRQDRDAFETAMQAESFDAAIDMICFNAEDAASSVRAFRDVSHFIQCSTTATYGVDYDILPVPEHHPLRPITDYGRGKVAADDVYLA